MHCQVGSTPVLSLLGGIFKTEEVQRPSVNENNIIMYLDMVNERVIELKSIAQFVDAQNALKEGKLIFHTIKHIRRYVDTSLRPIFSEPQ